MERPSWLTASPPAVLRGERVTLTRVQLEDVEALTAAANESLADLALWMPWAQEPATASSMGAFVSEALESWRSRKAFNYVTRKVPGASLVGGCGLHARRGPGTLEIGYWTHSAHIGRGIATAAADLLTATALELGGVERVEIRCDAANHRSAAVPRRLGYLLDGEEERRPEAPGETGRHLVWVRCRP